MDDVSVVARDGRQLAVAQFGDPSGIAIVFAHGSAESRLFETDVAWTAERGVRVVGIDRPGFGGSDPLPGRTVAGWSDDVADVVEHLGLEELFVLGWSGGGPHALACAARLGDRVRSAATVGSFAPLRDVPGAYDASPTHLQALADMAPGDPAGTAAVVAEVARTWVDDPDSFSLGDDTMVDPVLVEHPEWQANVSAQLHEGLRRVDGIAWDATALNGRWGFDLAAIACHVDVWHGETDPVTPVANAHWLAAQLPSATLRIVPGGHFIIYPCWREIIDGLLVHADR